MDGYIRVFLLILGLLFSGWALEGCAHDEHGPDPTHYLYPNPDAADDAYRHAYPAYYGIAPTQDFQQGVDRANQNYRDGTSY